MIENYDKLNELNKLIYKSQIAICDECNGFDRCNQDSKGIKPIIAMDNLSKIWNIVGTPCGKQRGNWYSHLNIKEYNDIYSNDKRDGIVNHLLKGKGGFIYGDGGNGKTYTLGYIANEFNKAGKTIYFDLANNISKKVFEFDTRQSTLNDIYNTDIFILDDFGGENFVAYKGFNTIFDVWLPIIKNRVDSKKTTYISSNYDLNTLAKRIKEVTDEITSTILMDRIKTLGVINFKDKNYRM